MNPLWDCPALRQVAEVRVEDIAPAVDALIADIRDTVEAIAATEAAPSWESVVAPQFAAIAVDGGGAFGWARCISSIVVVRLSATASKGS